MNFLIARLWGVRRIFDAVSGWLSFLMVLYEYEPKEGFKSLLLPSGVS